MLPENHPLINKYIQSNLFGQHLGMDFKIISPGHIEYRLNINTQHLATPKAAHGGVISALVDGALGVAGLSAVCGQNKVVSTVEYKLNFMAPAFLNDELLAIGKVEQLGKRLIIVSCEVICTNRNNQVISKALGTFNAYDAEKAGY